MYKIEVYNHQKLALALNLIPIIFKIITIYISFEGDNKYKGDNIYTYNNYTDKRNLYSIYWYFLPSLILIHLVFTILRAHSIIEIKSFMDLKYISSNKLLIFYGFIGALFNIIICTMATFLKCKDGNKDINISDYFCKVNKTEASNTYYDSFNIYFHTTNEPKEIIFEIIVEILAAICFFFYKYYSMMIIKFLSPAHLIFLIPFYYLSRKIILLIRSLFIYILNDKNEITIFRLSFMPYLQSKFVLDIIGDIFSFIVFLIYLEIIELNFYDLNYNLRRKIIWRSSEDLKEANEIELNNRFSINLEEE